MRMGVDRDSLVDRSAIVWRMAVAFGLCAVATLWAVPNMFDESKDGSWFHYLAGVIVGIGAIVLAAVVSPTKFVARKPTARNFLGVLAAVIAAQVVMSLWFDDMSASFQLLLVGAAVGIFSSLFVATYLVTERARQSVSEKPRISR